MKKSRGVMLRLRDVNPSSVVLTEREAAILRALMAERDKFACEGLIKECAAMGVAILITWRELASPTAEVPDTAAGDL